MGDAGLGLVLGLGLDPSGVKPGLDESQAEFANYEKSLDDATRQFNAGFEQTDKALLNNTQSVRLLARELGINLPRQVSSAIGEILPEIASMGTALLGVFAVEEVVKFIGWMRKAIDTANELTASEEAIHEAVKANDEIFEKIAHTSAKAGQEQLRLADIRLLAAQAEVDHQRDINEGLDHSLQQTQLLVNTFHTLFGQTKDLTKAEKELKEVTELRGKIASILYGDDIERSKKAAASAKHAAEEANRRSHQESEFIIRVTEEGDRSMKRMQKWHEEWLKSLGIPEEVKFSMNEVNRAVNQAGWAAAMALPPLTALGGGFVKLSEAERAALPLSDWITDSLIRQAQQVHEVVTTMQDEELPARARVELAYQRQVDAANREIAALRNEYQQHKITRAQMEADEQAFTQVMLDLAKQRQAGMATWIRQLNVQVAEMAQKGKLATESFDALGGATLRAGIAAAIYGENAGKAALQALKAALASIAEEAAVRAVFSLATYFIDMATYQYVAAGQALTAAELFGSIAAVSGIGAAAIPSGRQRGVGAGAPGRSEGYGGGEYGGGGGGERTYGEQGISGTGLAPGAVGSGSGRVNVWVMGEDEQCRQVASLINRAGASGHYIEVSASRRSAPAQG